MNDEVPAQGRRTMSSAAFAHIHAAARPMLLVLAFGYVLLLVPPFVYSLPAAGLDPSWTAVITYAAGQGWQWGRDIVFTYGPLGFLLPNVLLPERFAYALALNSILSGAVALGITAMLVRHRLSVVIATLLLMSYALAGMGRFAFQVVPVLAVLLFFRGDNKVARVTIPFLAAASGLYALVYSSAAVTAVAMYGIIDVVQVMRRRRPWCLAVFAAVAAAGYWSAGQSVSDMPAYLRSTFEIIAGYGGAMGSSGKVVELVAFLAASAAAFALLLIAESTRPAHAGRRAEAALMFAALGAYWFVAFKSGFVRHDLHSLWAWLALSFILAGYATVRWEALAATAMRALMVIVALGSGAVASVLMTRSLAPSMVLGDAIQRLVAQPERVFKQGLAAITAPGIWYAEQERQLANANNTIRELQPLPKVSGSVDVIPNMQSSVIAHGLAYRPRPVFQDYAVYTPWLIERNREHYRSARAADTLLFKPDDIDNRYPLLEQSTAILDILANYRPLKLDGPVLVMRRNATPVPVTSRPPRELTGELGQWITVPAIESKGLMLSLDLDLSLAGRLVALALRPPLVKLYTKTADGAEHEHLLIPGMARTGFLLSPRTNSGFSLARLAYNVGTVPLNEQVVAFKVDTASEAARWLYQSKLAFKLTGISVEGDGAGTPSDFWVQLRRNGLATEIAQRAGIKPSVIDVFGTELFAHAPARLSLVTGSASVLRAEFGIKEGAYSGQNATDGVCFRVLDSSDNGTRRLFERCLDPLARPADRGPQRLELALASGKPTTLVLETDCRTHCFFDWSYWKDIDVEP
jgi:hypothetical protein